MNKPASITFALTGVIAFLLSAVRPSLAGDAARFLRWQRRWS
jgi:hypothetical protein